jgi:monoamine oxidase
MGGQFVGPNQARVHALAREFGLELMPMYSSGDKIQDFAGRMSRYCTPFPVLSLWRPFPFVNLIGLGGAMGKLEILRRCVPIDRPWEAPHASEWDATSIEAWKRSCRIRPAEVSGMIDAIVRPAFGSETHEVSLLNFLFFLNSAGGLMSALEGQKLRFAYGSHQMSEKLAASLGDVVHLGEAVRAVQQTADEVFVAASSGTWAAKHVIITVPVPLTAEIAFDPPLPGLRVGLVERMPMGSEVKCFATYDAPFWREAGLSGEVVSDGGPVSVVFDNTTPGDKQPALLALVGGKHAHVWHRRPQDERRQAVLANFARWFGPRALKPTGFIEWDWRSEPWTRGCPLSIMSPGAWLSFGQVLREPVGRVHWAGSELSPDWCTYMDGALGSGEDTGRAVATIL